MWERCIESEQCCSTETSWTSREDEELCSFHPPRLSIISYMRTSLTSTRTEILTWHFSAWFFQRDKQTPEGLRLCCCVCCLPRPADDPSIQPRSRPTNQWHWGKTDWRATNCWSKFPPSTPQMTSILGSARSNESRRDEHSSRTTSTNKQAHWHCGCRTHRHTHTHTGSSPFMVVVHKGRHGADLDGVRVIGWIFKQAVVRVEQLSGHQEEKLSGGSTVVQPAIIIIIHRDVSRTSESVTLVRLQLLCNHTKHLKERYKHIYTGFCCRDESKWNLELQQRYTQTIICIVYFQQKKDTRLYNYLITKDMLSVILPSIKTANHLCNGHVCLLIFFHRSSSPPTCSSCSFTRRLWIYGDVIRRVRNCTFWSLR